MAIGQATDGELRARAGALTLLALAESKQRSEEGSFARAALERWLAARPAGPLALGPDAGPVLRTLADGWTSAAIHAAATGTLTAAEADEMARAGLLAATPERNGELRFAPTEWLRRAVGPLAAAARLEVADPREGAAPIDPLDVEAAFRLALPLIGDLPEEMSSSCRLLVTMPDRRAGLAGVVVLIERGEIASVSSDLTIWSDTFATGSPIEWIEAAIDPTKARLDLGGAFDVLLALVCGLHEQLFGGLGGMSKRRATDAP